MPIVVDMKKQQQGAKAVRTITKEANTIKEE